LNQPGQEELFAVNSSQTPPDYRKLKMSQSKQSGSQNPLGHFFPAEIRQRMSEDLKLTGKSERTQTAYLRAVRQLSDFAKKSPTDVNEREVRAFFLYLKDDCLFAYFWTVYTMGLRLNEGLNLQVGDIDAKRGLVHIHRGKGAKDRYIPIPVSTLKLLRVYWATHRHPRFLFPADGRNHTLAQDGISQATTPMSETAVQGAMKSIVKAMNFGKKVSTHTLRHSYATHLFEAGVSLKVIQKYMGHSSLQTTMIYLHLTETGETKAIEAIEELFGKLPGEDGNPGNDKTDGKDDGQDGPNASGPTAK
jgi:integrase